MADEQGVGGVCFPIQPGETVVSWEVFDAVAFGVKGTASFLDPNGVYITGSNSGYCGFGTRIIPEGAATFVVSFEVVFGPPFCIGEYGTTGTVEAVFS